MKEKDLIELGFQKGEIYIGEPEFYYYVKEITNGLGFITNTDDEAGDDGWFVEFFNTEIPVRYYDLDTVKNLFRLIEEGIVPNINQNKDE